MKTTRAVLALGVGLTVLLTACTATGTQESTAAGITVKRDGYGIPHVYADTTRALYSGYGYSVAEDRLFQMEMAKRSSVGTAAEVLGPDYVEIDKTARGSIDPPSIKDQLSRLPQAERDIFDGYAEGFNKRIDEVAADPDHLMPKQFLDGDFRPEHWTGYDVAMVWVQTMANRFSQSSSELANLQVLKSLQAKNGEEKGRQLFDQLIWAEEDPAAPTTVPRDQSTSLGDEPHAMSVEAGLSDVTQALPDANLTRMKNAGGGDWPHMKPEASNLWMVGADKTTDGTSVLMNGPQFGWFNPSYVYGVGLHGAGLDVAGNTPYAVPTVLFGTNKTISWGATAGPLDVNDVYQEVLDPSNEHAYRFDGGYRPMEIRNETIEVRGAADVAYPVYSTVHGRVTSFDTPNGSAYSLKESWAGYEIQSLVAWIDIMKATNWDEFLEQAKKVAITINWYYADNQGNIGYVSPGRLPVRPAGQDLRLPAVGDGSMEWEGIRSFEDNPQSYNPEQGYLANWNNQSAAGALADGYNWSPVDRVRAITTRLEAKDKFTPGEIWDINRQASFADLNVDYLLPYLEQATGQLPDGDPVASGVNLLRNWDGQATDDNADGVYDGPEPVIMRTWLPILFDAVIRDDLPDDVYASYAAKVYPAAGTARPAEATKLVYNALRGDESGVPQTTDFFNGADRMSVLRSTFGQAMDRLRAEQGPDPAGWKLPVGANRFDFKNYLGVPQAGSDEVLSLSPYMNRGTQNDRIVLGDGIADLCTVGPPGQSGFIAPDGTRSPHYSDQMDMYRNFQCKTDHLTEQSVDANKSGEVTLN
ncbi:penicillin acylase family protein [Rhodococcus koreensis]|uniref:penicillin acylase family protein n=1 Tax=Rhodococcus koreensis TaxID=99653 RepID=UPI00197EABFA|nr:penicillin acylase family protein [Rhodococcus koreensis]QSE79571.1 penicillin acylase family protein [Rhodococcus koreensis]